MYCNILQYFNKYIGGRLQIYWKHIACIAIYIAYIAIFIAIYYCNIYCNLVDKPFPATAQDRESMSFLRLRTGDSSNNSNQ